MSHLHEEKIKFLEDQNKAMEALSARQLAQNNVVHEEKIKEMERQLKSQDEILEQKAEKAKEPLLEQIDVLEEQLKRTESSQSQKTAESEEKLRTEIKKLQEQLDAQEVTLNQKTETIKSLSQTNGLVQASDLKADLTSLKETLKEKELALQVLTQERDDLSNDYFQLIDENVVLKDKIKALEDKMGITAAEVSTTP